MKLIRKTNIRKTNAVKNRTAMAPMTRSRATTDGVVSDLTTVYWRYQRASAGLIITGKVLIFQRRPWRQASMPGIGVYPRKQIDA